MADLGRHPRGGDDELTRAAGRVRVHEDHVGPVAEGDVFAADGVDALRYRHALARQRRLGHLERRGGQQPPVRGDDVAGLDGDDVARDELLGRKLEELAAATHLRLDDHHLLQCRVGGCRLAFLMEAEGRR